MHKQMFSEELSAFRDATRKWIEKEMVPFRQEWEEKGIVDPEVYRKAGEQGMLCISQSEKYGGLGLPFRYSCVVNEEFARTPLSGIAFYLHSDIIAPYIEHHGSEEQKMKYLPKMASGELISAIAMTEPAAGSDLQGLQTKATLDGDHWVINGQKTFISNGINADIVVVVANTDTEENWHGKFAQQSLFIVEKEAPGFERGRNLEKLGLKAQDTAELYFTDCRVPKDAIIGKPGMAFPYLMQELGRERLCIGVWCVANAQKVLEDAIKYCKERKAFGKSIDKFQNTRYKLAELATEIDLCEAYVDRTIVELEEGEDITIAGSKAKLWCSEMLARVTDECLQLYGGYGYMKEYDISQYYADARIQRIYGGTSEIMKEIISRDLLK